MQAWGADALHFVARLRQAARQSVHLSYSTSRHAAKQLGSKRDLLVRFALVMAANFDPHLPIQPFQKVEQLVGREAAEMSVHQVRHIGLGNTQNSRDLTLLQLLLF
jgi:hypothetical protein